MAPLEGVTGETVSTVFPFFYQLAVRLPAVRALRAVPALAAAAAPQVAEDLPDSKGQQADDRNQKNE